MATVRRNSGRSNAGDVGSDIFPGLGLFIACGAFTGAVVGVARQGTGNLFTHVADGSALGAILGLFIGLGRGVWCSKVPVRTSGSATTPDWLWDSWLDNGRDVETTPEGEAEAASTPVELDVKVEETDGLVAKLAAVRPRILSLETGEAIRLEDEIGRLIDEGRHNRIGIIGGPGSGKTTALQHLTAILPPWVLAHLRLVDVPRGYADTVSFGDDDAHLVISAASKLPADSHRQTYHLACWNQDDVIEYLLAVHRDRCASVMGILKAAGDSWFIQGIAQLWTAALDQMACDESVDSARTALTRIVEAWFVEYPDLKQITEDFCLSVIGKNSNRTLNLPLSNIPGETLQREHRVAELLRLIRHRPVGLLLAARKVASVVVNSRPSRDLSHPLPHDLINEASRLIADNALARQHLTAWIDRRDRHAVHPVAASLLHILTPGWRPGSNCRPRLTGAYLTGAVWPGIELAGVDLKSADLAQADLSSANLERCQVNQACFQRANLQRAILDSCIAVRVDLREANLRHVRAVKANLQRANLIRARLTEANLWKADLRNAHIEDTDFAQANLEDAVLKGLKLSVARFDGACFGGADMRGCNLESMVLASPDFHDTDLRGALLTGSSMPQANFLGADLGKARLAEIDWPDADLRDSDLRGASFHLGSSRNGLVGSTIACEGSRTGFYTDDYDDQFIKPAEEIRKANLQGADLRGAEIEGVDFYLVDLRDAKYSQAQANHFRHCRAILNNRVD